MLNNADKEFMKQARKEMVFNRETPVIVSYEGPGTVDDITGEVYPGETITRDVLAVVTEITGAEERLIMNGVEVETGDVRVDIDIDLVSDIDRKIERILYDDRNYVILALDKKGIGGPNRVEIVGRLIR